MSQILTCYYCNKQFPLIGGVIYRSDDCPHCSASLKCCRMCKHYDLKYTNECREPYAERILEKEKANSCRFYAPDDKEAQALAKENAAKAFDSLFKK